MLQVPPSTSTWTPVLKMFIQSGSNTVTVQAGFFGAGPPFAHIYCAPNILQVAKSVLTAVDEPPQFVFLCSRKMNIVSMNSKPPLEVVGVDSGGFHHVAADLTSSLRLVSWTVVGTIPIPTPLLGHHHHHLLEYPHHHLFAAHLRKGIQTSFSVFLFHQ
jgi:hypothetical protein